MPRYDTNMAGVVASIIGNIPAGHYKFKINTPKAFAKFEEKDGIKVLKNYGIRYPVEVVEVVTGDGKVGDKQFFTCYQHTKEAIEYAKAQHMVLCGFDQTREGEEAYNAKYLTGDYSFDTDSGEVGQAWKDCEGSYFEAVVSIKKDGDNENQKWNKMIPFQG